MSSFPDEAGVDFKVIDNSLTFVVIESSPVLRSCGLSLRLAIICFSIESRSDLDICFLIFNNKK